jgi:bifunctional UDP-N-acetylglucosamine pyrophosphorylase/glucosamine-1-phosphate N-acetyltransferase
MGAKSQKPQRISIVILAAGEGKRMRSSLPKVLQPLAGKPLLGHVIECAAALQPSSLHVVYGHGGAAVKSAFAGTAAIFWVEQAQQLGTGHAVAQAMPHIDDAQQVLVLYGDVPLVRAETLQQLVALADAKTVSLLTVQLANPSGYGRIVRNQRGDVRAIVEHKDATRAQLRINEGNSGILCAPAKSLRRWLAKLKSNNAQGEYYLTDIVAMAVKDRMKVRPLLASSETEVLGVNDKQQLATLEAAYRARRAAALMQAGVTVIDPARLDVRGEVSVGRDVELDVNVVLIGPVQLADGVRVGANCVINAATIGAGTEIRPNCVIERSEIGARCQIGPYTRVRPDSRIADEVHLGNFVEIKKSAIAQGSKVNHLTYLGDTVVGRGVNVGAGTITCNYDGVNKWVTEIGNNVFIGSGSMLVAPVKIGDGATIGAGSTITANAPDGQLTLERSRQVIVEGWQRPTKRTS